MRTRDYVCIHVCALFPSLSVFVFVFNVFLFSLACLVACWLACLLACLLAGWLAGCRACLLA